MGLQRSNSLPMTGASGGSTRSAAELMPIDQVVRFARSILEKEGKEPRASRGTDGYLFAARGLLRDRQIIASSLDDAFQKEAHARLDAVEECDAKITDPYKFFLKDGTKNYGLIVAAKVKELLSRLEYRAPPSYTTSDHETFRALLEPYIASCRKVLRDVEPGSRLSSESEVPLPAPTATERLIKEQAELDRSPRFKKYLLHLRKLFEKNKPSLYIFSASETAKSLDIDSHLSKFVDLLRDHLISIGLNPASTFLKKRSLLLGKPGSTYKKKLGKADSLLLIGTVSLGVKLGREDSLILKQWNLVTGMRKRGSIFDGKKIIPVLLSGSKEGSIPPPIDRERIINWKKRSYLENFQDLALRIFNLPVDDPFYMRDLGEIWEKTESL